MAEEGFLDKIKGMFSGGGKKPDPATTPVELDSRGGSKSKDYLKEYLGQVASTHESDPKATAQDKKLAEDLKVLASNDAFLADYLKKKKVTLAPDGENSKVDLQELVKHAQGFKTEGQAEGTENEVQQAGKRLDDSFAARGSFVMKGPKIDPEKTKDSNGEVWGGLGLAALAIGGLMAAGVDIIAALLITAVLMLIAMSTGLLGGLAGMLGFGPSASPNDKDPKVPGGTVLEPGMTVATPGKDLGLKQLPAGKEAEIAKKIDDSLNPAAAAADKAAQISTINAGTPPKEFTVFVAPNGAEGGILFAKGKDAADKPQLLRDNKTGKVIAMMDQASFVKLVEANADYKRVFEDALKAVPAPTEEEQNKIKPLWEKRAATPGHAFTPEETALLKKADDYGAALFAASKGATDKVMKLELEKKLSSGEYSLVPADPVARDVAASAEKEAAKTQLTKLTTDKEIDMTEFNELTGPGKTAEQRTVASTAGRVILTPKADGGNIGPVIYAKVEADGKLTDIQVAMEDGSLRKVKDGIGVFHKDKPDELNKLLEAAKDGATSDPIADKNATLVDDVRAPLTTLAAKAAGTPTMPARP